jgi:hypothetical protein
VEYLFYIYIYNLSRLPPVCSWAFLAEISANPGVVGWAEVKICDNNDHSVCVSFLIITTFDIITP